MKKKIGDLTLREKIKLCEKFSKCSKCPIYRLSLSIPCDVPFYTQELDELLNQEIEVEE